MQAQRVRKIKAPLLSVAWAIVALTGALSACSALPRDTARASAQPARQAPASLSLRQVATLPLQDGRRGLDTVATAIYRLAGNPGRPGSIAGDAVNADGPLTFSDGFRARIVLDYLQAGILSIGLEPMPCFSLADARAVTGAEPMQAVSYPYAEGPLRGTYSAFGSGMEVNLAGLSGPAQCVTELRLVDTKAAAGFADARRLQRPEE